MIIDNGARRTLVISGVFDGLCGESDGQLAFIPNQTVRPPEAARGGLLDGEPVSLTILREDPRSPFYFARYSRLS